MLSILVAFPKETDAERIKNLLVRTGYDVALSTSKGSKVINQCHKLDGGIVLCGYKLSDMIYLDLYDKLPKGFKIILLASPTRLMECYENEIIKVSMPLKINELIRNIENVLSELRLYQRREGRKRTRSEDDKLIINQAKDILMTTQSMTEPEAHRYIQKISMDSGKTMKETAEMIYLLNSYS